MMNKEVAIAIGIFGGGFLLSYLADLEKAKAQTPSSPAVLTDVEKLAGYVPIAGNDDLSLKHERPGYYGMPLARTYAAVLSDRCKERYESFLPAAWYAVAEDVGKSMGIPAGLMTAIMQQESGGRPWAFSDDPASTAAGLMQITYSTCVEVSGCQYSFNPYVNIKSGALILKSKSGKTWREKVKNYHGHKEDARNETYANSVSLKMKNISGQSLA